MVKSFIKIEIKRALFRWQTLVAFIIFMTAFIHISYMDKLDIPTHANYPKELILEQGNCFISYLKSIGFGSNSYMFIIIPLVIILVDGDSLIMDIKTGFLEFSLARVDYKKYIVSKLIAISIVSFLLMFIFQICAFIYSIFTSPWYFPKKLSEAPNLQPTFYLKHTFLYIFLIILIMSIISMAIILFGIAVSNKVESNFTAVILPWVLYVIVGEMLIAIDPIKTKYILYKYSPIIMSGSFIFDDNYSFFEVFIYWSMFSLISMLFSYSLFTRNFENERINKVTIT